MKKLLCFIGVLPFFGYVKTETGRQNEIPLFTSIEKKDPNPFRLDLAYGVVYSKFGPLVLTVDKKIDLTGSSWVIKPPDGEDIVITPDMDTNEFSWDGRTAPDGVYIFVLYIQGKRFTGQFLITFMPS